ncbi:hypothetical protein V492_04204, partial [Pseudogymnoascus sp. VKM F-4246]
MARDYLEFALTLEVTPGRGEEKVRFDANYQTSILTPVMVGVLLRQLEGVVTSMIAGKSEPGASVGREELAIYEGVSCPNANGTNGEKKTVATKRGVDRRATQIAGLVTGRDVQVSTQRHVGGKVRGYIGRVGPGVKVLVITPSSDEAVVLPLGAEGELCISSAGLEESSIEGARLVEHPTYGKFIRTGDLVRLLPSGEVVYRGRIGEDVAIAGRRVDFGEVEGVVLSHEAVGGECA